MNLKMEVARCRFVPLYRYVSVSSTTSPPAYAETDPFPFPLTTGQQWRQQQQQQQHQGGSVAATSIHEITLADADAADGPRDTV